MNRTVVRNHGERVALQLTPERLTAYFETAIKFDLAVVVVHPLAIEFWETVLFRGREMGLA